MLETKNNYIKVYDSSKLLSFHITTIVLMFNYKFNLSTKIKVIIIINLYVIN